MKSERKAEWIFVTFVVVLGALILMKTVRLNWYDGNLQVTIVQQKGSLSYLDVPRNASDSRTMPMKRIDFYQGRMLENSQYGKLGYTSNFFLDIKTDMLVAKPALYRFDVSSDDGFRLKIDGKTICEHPGDRPFAATRCTTVLSKGKHRYELGYFQGGGPMGLKATYGEASSQHRFVVGEDSSTITFEKSQK